MRTRAPLLLVVIGFAASVLLACGSTGPIPDEVREQVERDPAAALPKVEQLAQQYPGDYEVQMMLGQTHYKLARKALDVHDEATYLRHIEKATDQFVDGAAMRPADPGPHIYLAMVDAYQADMDGALKSLLKARELAPGSPISYTNLAQIYIYLGRMSRARSMLSRARNIGGPSPVVELNEMLAAWKEGDMTEARDLFDSVYAAAPEFVQTWDEAPVSTPIESFSDFVAYCCGNPSCGPYMRGPCEKAKQEVAEREVTLETLRREQQLARETREKLRKVYSGEREVTIEGEEPDAPKKSEPKKTAP